MNFRLLHSPLAERSLAVRIYREAMKNSGITLIELLIVLAISSLMVSGLFTLYLQVKEHHRYHYALQEMTEEIRFVNQLLERAFQGAGYLGLTSWNQIPVYDNLNKSFLNHPIISLKETDSNLSENIRKKIKPGTQAIELRQMDFSVTSLAKNAEIGESETNIYFQTSSNLKKDDLIIIADAAHAEINCIASIQTLSNQQQVIQLHEPLHYNYAEGSYVGHYFDKIYFIGDTGNFFPDKEKIFGLYMYSENGMTEEVTELVSDTEFQWLKEKTIEVSMTFTLPYWINGKYVSRKEEFVVTNRE